MHLHNVLSLFDGISCGQLALQRANITYDNYYASEIDKDAIKVTQTHFPDTIQLGDVKKIDKSCVQNIDLLLGGSPCQGFSYAGKMRNFDDPRSKLFFEYVRILKVFKPKYFLFENVKMKKTYIDSISTHLKVDPIFIDSEIVCANRRPRLYWTNIKNVTLPKRKDITIDDIIDFPNADDKVWLSQDDIIRLSKWQQPPFKGACVYGNKQKMRCLCGSNFQKYYKGRLLIKQNNKYRYLTDLEAERCLTIPDNYLKSIINSVYKKCHLIGNSWTIDVIVHILSFMKHT